MLGASLVGVGIALLIAHNWDELSRPIRSTIAFLPLLASHALVVFVLARRAESQPWRETAAIFNVAAVSVAIALIGQTYQIQGDFAGFILVWMLVSIPVVYLLRTTFGAAAYLVGATVWLASKISWTRADGTALWFWALWALTIPFLVMLFRRDRYGREAATLAMFQFAAAMFGVGATAVLSHANLGALGFCGLFTAVYLAGAQFLPKPNDEQPHPLPQLGMIGVGVVAVLLSFEWMWDFSAVSDSRLAAIPNAFAILVQLGWPVVAMLLAGAPLRWRREMQFNYVAALLPVMAGIT